MCAGIVSESLVQNLAVEGINLPPTVIQRGIDSYVVHTDTGSTRLETPQLERRIGWSFAVLAGGIQDNQWRSFDGFLLEQATRKGATLIGKRVDDVSRDTDGRLLVKPRGGSPEPYDLLAVAAGVNTNALKLFKPLDIGFNQPDTVRTFIHEYYLGKRCDRAVSGRAHYSLLLAQHSRHGFCCHRPERRLCHRCLVG